MRRLRDRCAPQGLAEIMDFRRRRPELNYFHHPDPAVAFVLIFVVSCWGLCRASPSEGGAVEPPAFRFAHDLRLPALCGRPCPCFSGTRIRCRSTRRISRDNIRRCEFGGGLLLRSGGIPRGTSVMETTRSTRGGAGRDLSNGRIDPAKRMIPERSRRIPEPLSQAEVGSRFPGKVPWSD